MNTWLIYLINSKIIIISSSLIFSIILILFTIEYYLLTKGLTKIDNKYIAISSSRKFLINGLIGFIVTVTTLIYYAYNRNGFIMITQEIGIIFLGYIVGLFVAAICSKRREHK